MIGGVKGMAAGAGAARLRGPSFRPEVVKALRCLSEEPNLARCPFVGFWALELFNKHLWG
jgi:hypothetical protein